MTSAWTDSLTCVAIEELGPVTPRSLPGPLGACNVEAPSDDAKIPERTVNNATPSVIAEDCLKTDEETFAVEARGD